MYKWSYARLMASGLPPQDLPCTSSFLLESHYPIIGISQHEIISSSGYIENERTYIITLLKKSNSLIHFLIKIQKGHNQSSVLLSKEMPPLDNVEPTSTSVG